MANRTRRDWLWSELRWEGTGRVHYVDGVPLISHWVRVLVYGLRPVETRLYRQIGKRITDNLNAIRRNHDLLDELRPAVEVDLEILRGMNPENKPKPDEPQYPFPVHILDWKTGELVRSGGDDESLRVVIVNGICVSELERGSDVEVYFTPREVLKLRYEMASNRKNKTDYATMSASYYYYRYCESRILAGVLRYNFLMRTDNPKLDGIKTRIYDDVHRDIENREQELEKIRSWWAVWQK